jgi:hypothetical protein
MSRLPLAIGIVVLIVVIVAGGYVGLTSLNSSSSSPSPTPFVSPTLAPTENTSPSPSSSAAPEVSAQQQVRDDALTYIGLTHSETLPIIADISWTGGRQETMLLGAETYLYTSGNWTLQVHNAVVLNPVYTISANYTADDVTVQWTGTSENGTITETSYTSTGLVSVPSTLAQVRDAVIAYLQANHTEIASYLQVSTWTCQRLTPEGLVGYETYQYTSMGWNMTIGYVVYYDITYNVDLLYQPTPASIIMVDWQGTVHNGTVTEVGYVYTPDPSSTAVTGGGNLPLLS